MSGAAESKFIGQLDSYLDAFRDVLEKRDDLSRRVPDLLDGIRDRFADIYAANLDLAVDGNAQGLLNTVSAIAAAYTCLRDAGLEDGDILPILHEAVVEPKRSHVRDWLARRMDITPDRPDEAFDKAAVNFRARGEALFGESFRYEQDVRNDRQSFVNVRRCFFNDAFSRIGLPQLTPLICALDIVWADELTRGGYNVRLERPSTLAGGSDACRFHFHRVDPKSR